MALEMNLAKSRYPPDQTLHLLCPAWRPHVYKRLYLLWIGFYASQVDHEPNKFLGDHAEYVLERVQLHAIRPEDIEHLGQVRDMVRGNLGLNEHVIYIDLHRFADLFLKHHIDQPLVGRSHILKSKRHHLIAVQAVVCDERGVILIWYMHRDLVIP